MQLSDRLGLAVLLIATGMLTSAGGWQSARPGLQSSDQSTKVNDSVASPYMDKPFSNQFLSLTILPGWMERTVDQTLELSHGKYTLSINPMFVHASGVTGGRFSEIVAEMPSVTAVMRNVDQPAGGWECSQTDRMLVTSSMSLLNLYTDKSKTGSGCTFPSDPHPAWFGSLFSGSDHESDYAITLSYDTADVNTMPKRNSPELKSIFRDVVAMLKTLSLKPPVLITKVDPEAASPGATVTVYGKGFRIGNYSLTLMFREFPNNPMPKPTIAPDWNSLMFVVPTSIDTIACQPGYLDVNENCVPMPADQVDINDCPNFARFCGVPILPGIYHIMVDLEGTGVQSNLAAFTVVPLPPTPVSILLLYPNNLVLVGDKITVRGSGFTPTGNTVHIGFAILSNISSVDGKTITFRAPMPTGKSSFPGIQIYEAFVSNGNGKSNSIALGYR